MIKEDVLNLKEEIRSTELYKEYINLKNQIKNSAELEYLSKNINLSKQGMTNNLLNKEKHKEYLDTYNKLKNEYDNHPLIQNFNEVKDELINELNLIRECIKE